MRAQEKAARDQRERDREIEQQALVGTLRAIEAELTVHKRALEHLSDRVKKTPAEWPLATMPVDQNFFIVYEANAASLGKIDNQDLLVEIVRVYAQAKGLEGSLNFNHQRFALWANLQDNLPASDSAQSSQDRLLRERLDNLTKELVAMKRNIAGNLETLLLDLNYVLGTLAAYLTSQKKSGN